MDFIPTKGHSNFQLESAKGKFCCSLSFQRINEVS